MLIVIVSMFVVLFAMLKVIVYMLIVVPYCQFNKPDVTNSDLMTNGFVVSTAGQEKNKRKRFFIFT